MNRRISGLCAAIALIIILMCLAQSIWGSNPKYEAEALANRRIHILQSVFEGTITKQAAELELRRIESESLLSRDLQALTEQKEKKAPEPEIEEAVYLGKIRDIRQKKQYYEYTMYEAELDSLKKNEKTILRYNLVVKKTGDTCSLTIFEPAKV